MPKKVLLLLLLSFVSLLSKQSYPQYTTLEDYIPDEYDQDSLKLYPLQKLKNLNDTRLLHFLEDSEMQILRRLQEEQSTTDAQKAAYGFRIPMHIMTEDGIKNGGFMLYLIGVIYLYLFVYMIYKKFIFRIIENLVFLIEDNQEFYRPIVYCLLNSIIYLFITIFALIDPQSNYGVGNLLGTDAFNIYLLFGIIQFKYYEEQGQTDIWMYLRDSIFYLIGMGLLSFFYLIDSVKWWIAFIFLGYYLIFIIVQSKNASLKDSIQKLLGLKHDDDSFNCEEQLTFKKRRESSTELLSYINNNDPQLKKKIMYMDNCLKQDPIFKSNFLSNFFQKEDPNKYKIHSKFQQAVYRIIYAIRNKNAEEKFKRSKFYADLYKKDNKDPKKSRFHQMMDSLLLIIIYIQFQDDDISNNRESDQFLNNQDNINNQSNNDDMPFDDDQPQNMNDQLSRHSSLNRNANMHLDANNQKNEDGELVAGKDLEDQNQFDDDDEEIEKVSLSCPNGGIGTKILYIIELPILLILYWLPDLSKKATIKRYAFSLILNFLLLCGCIFFIIEWTHVICFAFQMEASTAGFSAGAIAVSIPYCIYNIRIAKDDKEVDFMQSFLQLGIYKLGICASLSWLLSSMIFGDGDMGAGRSPKTFGIVLAVFTGIFFLTIVLTIISGFKFRKCNSVIYFIFYLGFFIASIIIMEVGSSSS